MDLRRPPDVIKVSLDHGENWTEHTCLKASRCWQMVGNGYAITQIMGMDMDPMPEEDDSGNVMVRIVDGEGNLWPAKPLYAKVRHYTTNPRSNEPIPTVLFDGRGVRQI